MQTVFWNWPFLYHEAQAHTPVLTAHPNKKSPPSTSLTHLRPTAWELTRYFESFPEMGEPSAASSSNFTVFIATASVLLMLPLPSWVKSCSETLGRDMFPIRLTNRNRLALANCKRVSVHHVAVYQTHAGTCYIRTGRRWRSLSNMLSSTTWAHLPICGRNIQFRNNCLRFVTLSATAATSSIARMMMLMSCFLENGSNVVVNDILLPLNFIRISSRYFNWWSCILGFKT